MTSLFIWLIQLQGIDKNMKLIWLKGVKEPTGECHKQWMVTAWRKINDRGWSQSRVLLGNVTLFLEKSCLLALVVWSKGKLDRFNEGGYNKSDSWNIDIAAKNVWLDCRWQLYALFEIYFNLLLGNDYLYPHFICIYGIIMQYHNDSLVVCRAVVVTL